MVIKTVMHAVTAVEVLVCQVYQVNVSQNLSHVFKTSHHLQDVKYLTDILHNY